MVFIVSLLYSTQSLPHYVVEKGKQANPENCYQNTYSKFNWFGSQGLCSI